MTQMEIEEMAAIEAGHQMQCFEVHAEMAVEAGEVDGYDSDAQIALFKIEARDGWKAGRKCQCIDEVTGYYLPDLAEMRAAGVAI